MIMAPSGVQKGFRRSSDKKNANQVTAAGTRSFYIEKELLNKLEFNAKQRGISINALVNELLREYVEYLIPLEKYGYILQCKPAFKDLLYRLPKEDVIKAAEENGRSCRLFWYEQQGHDMNLISIEDVLKTACKYAKWGSYTEEVKMGAKIISINHEMGIIFSIYMKAFLDYLFTLLPYAEMSRMKVNAYEKCIIWHQ
jgi:hypothetical protein